MIVVVFPITHPGKRRPSAFVLHVPTLVDSRTSLLLSGIDAAAMAAVQAKVDELKVAYDGAQRVANELSALLKPFVVEGME